MTATVAGSEPPVYSKTGELIDNYGSNNAIISGGSNSATKRKNTKVLSTAKRGPASVQNSNKKKGQQGKLSHGVQGNLKNDADIFLTAQTGGKTLLLIQMSGP